MDLDKIYSFFYKIYLRLKVKYDVGDSMSRVKETLNKIEDRISSIEDERNELIVIGQQEVKDIQQLLEDTQKRVQTENAKHSAVVNETTTYLEAVKAVKKVKSSKTVIGTKE